VGLGRKKEDFQGIGGFKGFGFIFQEELLKGSWGLNAKGRRISYYQEGLEFGTTPN